MMKKKCQGWVGQLNLMYKLKLYCLPYAGGSALIFSSWKKYLSLEIELIPIELSGRGRRIHESLYNNLTDVIEDVFQIFKNDVNHMPYAIFGHSMGAMLSYELVQKIIDSNLPQPKHVFFSGRSAPHLEDNKQYHLMDDTLFKEEIIKMGGTPMEIFKHPELSQLFLPLLKNDFRISETRIRNNKILPIEPSITVFFGKDEDLRPEQCDGWKRYTKKICSIHYFDGGHFFLNEKTKEIVGLINNTLSKSI